ncbi:PREDICTED: uncharacterized protein LOC109478699 isoform X2 [Branchiostoma belcheri]|nr:PREDICTED: uncharacterized protein LOC109478699 isoform X2 [Branchiostoma belcheri]XP_019635957.1 PREDICTED: uncharacterized protein LOC109478699 isoform X2 [Branchiostoma belcheri]
MLRERAAETGGNITAEIALEIAAADKLEPAKVQIGVVGDAGAGKSTFINSFRRLSPGDVGAAEVSAIGHTTIQPTPYDVPEKDLVLVDFPGVLFKPKMDAIPHKPQQVDFNINSYLDLFGKNMQECDFFLIFVTNRPSNNVVWIAKEVRKMGKRLLFVRSQADVDIEKARRDSPKDFPKSIDRKISEKRMMERFRQSTKETLEDIGYGKVDDGDIFIISGLKDHVHRGLYDMKGLNSAMLNCLPTCKQEVLIRNIQDFSADTVTQKAVVMRKRTWALAAWAAAVSAAPVPALGVALDIAALFVAYKALRRAFNIDDASLEQLANICNKSAFTLMRFRNQNSTLWNAIKNSSGPVALRNLAAAAASSVTIASLLVTSVTAKIALPIIGGIIAAPASFALIVLLVRKFIEEMEMCATKLFKFAFSEDVGPADIGIVGDGNAGETSFIKYFGSLLQEEEGDQSKPITKTRFHTTLDNVVLVELPPPHVKKKLFRRTFDEEAYMKSFADDMRACSVLLVFIGKPISEGLLTIARKAKEMELDVLFIRTCLDEDELMYIDSIRKEAHKDLKANIDDIAITDIFVVDVQYDSIVEDKWDISFLRTAILHAIDKIDMTDRNLMLLEKQEDMPIIALKEGKSGRPSDDILRALNGCTGTIKPTLPDWKTAVISIQLGVIGDAEEDADITTFSQSLLGLDNLRRPAQASDPAQATVYRNPGHPCNISVVHFPPASLSPGQSGALYVSRYMEFHGDKMKDCDLFLVFCQDKVTEEAAWVASKAMEMSKKVLLVGSKHDHTAALGAAAALPAEDTENRELCHKLTKQLQQHLHNAGSTEVMGTNSTFIISDEADDMLMGKLDMVRLKTAILSRLNDLQRQAFVICCPDLSPDFVSKKAGVLKKLAWVQAVDAMDVNQGPGLLVETPVKIEIVREACELSQKCFGLDEASLTKIAAVSGTDVQELKIFAQRNLPMCTKLLSEDTDPTPPDNIRTLASLLSENSSTLLTLGLANWAFSTTVSITGFGGKALNVVAYFLCKMIDEQAECAKELHNFAFHK